MTVSTLSTVTLAAVTASVTVDRALNKAVDAKQAWAVFSASAIIDGRADMNAVADAIVTACKGRLPKAKAAHLNTIPDCSKAGFGTIVGWYYDLRRVEKAGRLVELTGPTPANLTTLRRGTESTTANKGKAGKTAPVAKGKAPPTGEAPLVQPPLPAATFTLAQMADHLEGEGKRLSVKALRNMQPELSRILHAVAAMQNRIDVAIRAELKAKEVKAATVAASKAGRSTRRKAA